jgi:lambda family phage minor tail protein L
MTETAHTSPAITAEIQKLAPSAVIELYVLDLSIFGQGPVRFHAGTNALLQRVVWQGYAYEAFPIQVEGFEFNGGGQVPRPRLRVANVTGSITALVLSYQDLVGARITRKRTLAKYLDAVNFEGG